MQICRFIMANLFPLSSSRRQLSTFTRFAAPLVIIVALCHLCSSVSSTRIQCLDQDRSLLLQIKRELDIDTDYRSIITADNIVLPYPQPTPKVWSWNDTGGRNHEDCCLWEGVTCDSQSGHVVGLDLSSSSIVGGINASSSIFRLQHLRRLSLADNNFFFGPPYTSTFSNLSTTLTHLNMSGSGNWDPILVQEIRRLGMLASLDISNVDTFDNMEKLVKNLTRLRVLHLNGIHLSDTTTNMSWSSLPDHLLELSLQDCGLTGDALQFPNLLSLKSLTHLVLSKNYDLAWNVSGYSIDSFPNLTNLQLSGCSLYGTLPSSAFSHPNLQILDVSYNSNLTVTLPHFPAASSSLQVLQLSETIISADMPDSFNNLVSLQELSLSNCEFYGTFPTSVFLHPTLRILDVSYNSNLTVTLPHFPAGNSSLQVLRLSHTNFSGEIPDSINNLVSLQELHLSNCSFYGRFPPSVFLHPTLRFLGVAYNALLTGTLPEFPAGRSQLQVIELSYTKFSGELPHSINNLESLQELYLANCTFHGLVPSSINTLTGLRHLSFVGNDFSGPLPSLLASSNNIEYLDFSSNNFSGTIPPSYDQFDNLDTLDLSNNHLQGQIPPLLGHPRIGRLRLSSNQLEGELMEVHNPSPRFAEIDLSDNKLQGHLPLSILKITTLGYLSVASNNFSGRIDLVVDTALKNLIVLDLSDNHFQVVASSTPDSEFFHRLDALRLRSCNMESFPDFSRGFWTLSALDLSGNNLVGGISPSICDLHDLQILDLSTNHLNGSVPPCLASLAYLNVLRLRDNQLSGMLPGGFAPNCSLRTLDVNRNHLSNQLPKSLGFCKDLEVIDVGKNNLTGKFPVWLENLPWLRILVLHSNQFGGSIESRNPNAFGLLQIFDVSSNKFVGKLPSGWFRGWKAMVKPAPIDSPNGLISFTRYQDPRRFLFRSYELYYQDSVTVTIKGIEREYSKILTFYILIDVSNNGFVGEIPETIAQLESLRLLNLSNNHFTGHIPTSFEQLSKLESLDLSSNELSGNIPLQLTKLSFMSVMNLSHNLLTGEIPRGPPWDTFGPEFYAGNPGLCGFQLAKSCSEEKPSSGSPTARVVGGGQSQSVIDWEYFPVGIGSGVGAGIILGILLAKLVFGNPFIPPKTRRVRRIAVRPFRN